MNMFKPVDAKTSAEYMAKLPDERKEILEKIDALIKKVAPKLKQNYIYNMPGYGTFEYTNYKKETLQWPVISIASQKNYVSIYVCSIDGNEYVAEKFKEKLGKVNVGKSCIRFKKLEDINMKTLEEVIKIAAKNPGLVYAADKKKK
jgi:uncharacterized protein YdhG (YjbR/CyaY superfamily)